MTAVTLPPLFVSSPAMWKSFGMTTYGVVDAVRGSPALLVNAVSGWKQQSVFSLHWVVRLPSQSMSMSAVQKMAPLSPQMFVFAPLSSAYECDDTTLLHARVRFKSCDTVAPPVGGGGMGGGVVGGGGGVP